MLLINEVLYYFGFLIVKIRDRFGIPKEFIVDYIKTLTRLKKYNKELNIFRELRYETGGHPTSYRDYESAFVATHLYKLSPRRILDIGSHRLFIIGLLSHYKIVTLDFRNRKPITDNETVVTSDAKSLEFPDNEFDMILSLSTLEHFGLGRYGDEFDLDADKKSFKEMIRVLKPGGHIIFTTHITHKQPSIVFNAHRNYSLEQIRCFCSNLICEEEKFYSHKLGDFCEFEEVTVRPGECDVYCGCWRK